MTNSDLLSFFFICLIISSVSFITNCKAEASKDTKLVHDTRLRRQPNNRVTFSQTFVHHSRKTLNRPLKGSQMLINEQEKHFDYIEGGPSGPKNWGNLNPDWKSCADGKSQSPINIDVKHAKVQQGDLKRAYMDAPAKLINGGHNIAVEWQGDAGGIVVNGSTYKLVQCHWHVPSEHTIDGKKFDAELHLVHSNNKKQNAVIGILHTIGEPNPFIGNLTDKIKRLGTIKGIDVGNISASSIMFSSKKYFRYAGSLTTPPCKEGVIWTIAEKVKTISHDQIKLLKGVLQHGFQENARPLQEFNGRLVSQFSIP